MPNVTLGVVLVAGAAAAAQGALTIGELVAFVSLQLMLIWPVQSLGWIIANGQEAATAADRIQEVLDTPPEIVDSPGALALPRDAVHGRLRFERVAFSYPGAAAPVLREIDLTIEPGETLALVGATGSGKSTLLSLVPRLHDVTAGRITLDGHDLRELRLASLRRLVGVAFEEPTLFSMSVRENLTLGRPDAGDDEVRAALALAQADFAYDLPWGLATRVGEQGLSLSGGQRQRLALARAVLGRPRGAGAGRPAVRARRAHRGAGRGGAAAGPARQHRAAGRAPAVDDRAGRPGRAAGGRPDHRDRPALRAARHRAGVPGAARRRAAPPRHPPPAGASGPSSSASDGWGLVRS